jgi:hypothetical protein
VGFSEGTARPLQPEEQALYDAVQEAARGVLETDAATLTVRWYRWEDAPSFPEFVLRPRRRDALPISLSTTGMTYFDLTLYLDAETTSNELWAETEQERLSLTREVVEAVVAGRVEVALRRRERPLIFRWRASTVGWGIVMTFHLAGGPRSWSRSPTSPQEWGDAFAGWPNDEVTGVVGPRRFAAYGEMGSSTRGVASPSSAG